MYNMDKDGKGTEKLYRCRSKFALSKLIMDNGLEDLWRRENPDASEFTSYNRSSDTRSRLYAIHAGYITNNTNIRHKMISFYDHYNAIIIDRFPSKTRIVKDSAPTEDADREVPSREDSGSVSGSESDSESCSSSGSQDESDSRSVTPSEEFPVQPSMETLPVTLKNYATL